jgi:hypothetical protein
MTFALPAPIAAAAQNAGIALEFGVNENGF